MSEYVDVIKKSMNQTTECQKIANTLMDYCNELVVEVKRLQEENKLLKEALHGT